ncbi:MAG: phage holin family protein [Christensenellales bacterium]|jgi:hypothetical protein
METIYVPSITALVYLMIMMYKELVGKSEKFRKIIPMLAGIMGMGLSVLAFYTAPNLLPAKDIINALLIGCVSGLAATGANQIFKQLNNGKK